MRYEPDHKARTRRRIVKNAAQRLLAEGLSGVRIATVMKASGLTVGAFYKHFRSKDDLLAHAIEEGCAQVGERVSDALKTVPCGDRWRHVVRWSLSFDYRDRPDTRSPMAALAPEIARAAPAVRERIAGLMKARKKKAMEFVPGNTISEKERSFNVIFAAMIGAVVIARMMPGPADKENVLGCVRDHLLETF